MTEEDEWVNVAMDDDTLVVELLLKLNQPGRQQRRRPPGRGGGGGRRQRRRFAGDLVKEGAVLALSVDWSVRQRRSSSSSKQVMTTRRKNGSDSSMSARASPTTPLSFSGGTSVSGCGGGGGGAGAGAGDGFDEATTSASLPAKLLVTSRSKVAVTSETPTFKRSRKKKTLVELREEESLLLRERRLLKSKLASFRVSVEEERARNESLKRRKLDLLSQQRPEICTASVKSEDVISIQPQEVKAACDSTYSMLPHNASFQLQEDEDERRKPSFMLPDLNLPVEGDSDSVF